MKRDIVIFAMSRLREWDAGFVNRNFHIYQQLLHCEDIEKIVLIDAPATTFKRAVRVFVEDIILMRSKNIVWRSLSTVVTEKIPGKVYHVTSILPFISEKYFAKTLQEIINRLSISKPILWSYTPTYIQAFLDIDSSCRIFDAVDDWTAHPSYHSIRLRLEKNYKTIAESADIIFTVSESLTGRFSTHTNVSWIPNGVSISQFSSITSRTVVDQIPMPRIVYVGVIQDRFDVGLLAELAKHRPQYHFVIIGWVWKGIDVTSLTSYANIHFMGRIPYSQVPGVLRTSSVGIVPHHIDALVESMNPLKIYEYLAAGLPVVTTKIPPMGIHSEYITQAATAKEFISALDKWVANMPDRAVVSQSIAYADWSARFHQMWSILTNILQNKES